MPSRSWPDRLLAVAILVVSALAGVLVVDRVVRVAASLAVPAEEAPRQAHARTASSILVSGGERPGLPGP